jgi:peptidyl-prolyl cis-trans isomerase SurA
VKSTTPAGNKTLTEARGMVLSDYTAYLEQEWLKELKAKYEVKVDQGLMNKVEKALE